MSICALLRATYGAIENAASSETRKSVIEQVISEIKKNHTIL